MRVPTSVSRQRGFWNFVVPAVAGIAGSLLGNKSSKDAAEANREAQADANAQNLAAQREFAQMGLRWKVADARAAGLHPLSAIGASGASFSPSFQVSEPERPQNYGWLTQLGQLLGDFIGNQQRQELASGAPYDTPYGMHDRPSIEELHGVYTRPIQGLESQIEGRPLGWEIYDANRGVFEQPLRPTVDPLAKDYVTSASNAPFWQRFAFGPSKFNVILPKTSEPQEVFEDKPLWFWAMVAKANVTEYGPGWLTQARRQFPSLRNVWDGVIQELESSGILPSVRGAVPSWIRR